MDLLITSGVFVLGLALGAMGYRYALKRDPETLERWAKEIKARSERL